MRATPWRGEDVGGVAGFVAGRFVVPPALAGGAIDVGVMFAVAVDDAAELVEAEAGGHVRGMETEVPFAVHGGGGVQVFGSCP